jgi:RimJ/RimL family protein N-acetyltransferase
MAKAPSTTRTFPWSDTVGDREITFSLMSEADREALLRFTKSLPESVIVFLRMDISRPEIVDLWLQNIDKGFTSTVLAYEGDEIVGYGSLHYNKMLWTRHLGEIRILVKEELREDGELEHRLASEVFGLGKELGLHRITAQIPATQPRVRAMYERLGFQPEALLSDWLMSSDGSTHDLLVMSARLEEE